MLLSYRSGGHVLSLVVLESDGEGGPKETFGFEAALGVVAYGSAPKIPVKLLCGVEPVVKFLGLFGRAPEGLCAADSVEVGVRHHYNSSINGTGWLSSPSIDSSPPIMMWLVLTSQLTLPLTLNSPAKLQYLS